MSFAFQLWFSILTSALIATACDAGCPRHTVQDGNRCKSAAAADAAAESQASDAKAARAPTAAAGSMSSAADGGAAARRDAELSTHHAGSRADGASGALAAGSATAGARMEQAGAGGVDPVMPARQALDLLSGTVLDELRRPVPQAIVRIGTEEATSDANGHFSLPMPSVPYDVLFSNHPASESRRPIWIVEGLTRRDPTISCHECFGPERRATAALHFNGASAGQTIQVAVGGSDLNSWLGTQQLETNMQFRWLGPAVTDVVLHGLLFDVDPMTQAVNYLSHESRTTRLSDVAADVTFAFPRTALPKIGLSGRIEPANRKYYRTTIHLRWDDGATLLHYLSASQLNAFAANAPLIPNARVTLVATASDVDNSTGTAASSSALVDEITSPQIELTVALPAWPELNGPASNAKVDASTEFSWSDTGAHVWTWHAYNERSSVMITTGERLLRIPAELIGSSFPANEIFNWRVISWPSFADVDAVAKAGMFQSWGPAGLTGTARGSDTIATSELRTFSVAP